MESGDIKTRIEFLYSDFLLATLYCTWQWRSAMLSRRDTAG
jgi:hypothetical protein